MSLQEAITFLKKIRGAVELEDSNGEILSIEFSENETRVHLKRGIQYYLRRKGISGRNSSMATFSISKLIKVAKELDNLEYTVEVFLGKDLLIRMGSKANPTFLRFIGPMEIGSGAMKLIKGVLLGK